MKPEKHAGTHPMTGSLPGQKPTKLSGLTENAEGADAGGFLALLASQGPDFQSVAEVAEADGSDMLGTLSVKASVTDLNASESLAAMNDTAQSAGDALQIDLTFLLSQSGLLPLTDRLESLQVLPPAAAGGLSAVALVPNVAGSEGLPLDQVKNASGDPGDIATSGIGIKPSGLYRPTADLSTVPFPDISTALASVASASLNRDKAGSADKIPGKALADNSGTPSDALVQSKAQDLRVLKLSATADNFVSRTPSVDPILVRSVAENDLRQIERQLTKAQTGPSSMTTDGIFGSPVQFSGERLGFSPAASSAEGAKPEVYVAEQVNYWISRDVQNAELKLKGFDDLPIDVHISMQGNDAQVDFRTDHAEIRDILRTAESHLKDMLAREGLVLSGVSVGTSRRDEQGQGGQQQPSFPRQQAVVVEDHLPLSGVSRPASRSGGAIDVFV